MRVIGVIPARYGSTRFTGKPLADICGKPMIWWVYQQVIKTQGLVDVFVATDDERIMNECKKLDINVIMTSTAHPDHISRIKEVSDKVEADYYICVNGDEPLIDPVSIAKLIPNIESKDFYFGGAMRVLSNPAQAIDFANIKIVVNKNNECIYMSRTPIPYPKGTLDFKYNKYIGIECFNKKALDFFVDKEMGMIEKIEDIDHLRFIENNKILKFTYVDSESLSVDTPKDLEYVRKIIKEKIDKGELINE